LVNAVLGSLEQIAAGNVGGAAAYIERTLAQALPLVISFLANLLGLGGISRKVQEIIERVKAPIDRAIQWIVQKATAMARRLLAAMRGRGRGGDDGKSDQDDELLQNPEKHQQFEDGRAAIIREERRYANEDNQLDEESAQNVASVVKRQNPIFASLHPIADNETWDYGYTLQRAKFDGQIERVDVKSKLDHGIGLLRESLPGLLNQTSLGKNIAHAHVKFQKNEETVAASMYGISGRGGEKAMEDVIKNTGVEVVSYDPDNPFAIKGRGFPLSGGKFGYKRGNFEDAEAKILSHIKQLLEQADLPAGTKVDIDLYTEQIPCSGCNSSLANFKQWAVKDKQYTLELKVTYSFDTSDERGAYPYENK
jgi:hypothetical protein